jgi:hypothetical protein
MQADDTPRTRSGANPKARSAHLAFLIANIRSRQTPITRRRDGHRPIRTDMLRESPMLLPRSQRQRT